MGQVYNVLPRVSWTCGGLHVALHKKCFKKLGVRNRTFTSGQLACYNRWRPSLREMQVLQHDAIKDAKIVKNRQKRKSRSSQGSEPGLRRVVVNASQAINRHPKHVNKSSCITPGCRMHVIPVGDTGTWNFDDGRPLFGIEKLSLQGLGLHHGCLI